ncbi:hypothetical protein [Vibrio bivalvicida]|uniref:Uncharacterized protein n=1 Tax=Vibrio bivalvicida TaxID=1276888 RepID=A0ABV4MG61_9VIBR
MLTPIDTYDVEVQEIELTNIRDWLIALPKEMAPREEIPESEFGC